MYGREARIGVLTFDQQKLSDLHFNGDLDETISITRSRPRMPLGAVYFDKSKFSRSAAGEAGCAGDCQTERSPPA